MDRITPVAVCRSVISQKGHGVEKLERERKERQDGEESRPSGQYARDCVGRTTREKWPRQIGNEGTGRERGRRKDKMKK